MARTIITTSDNYLRDRFMAESAGAIAPNARPKKPELYAIIQAWNDAAQAEAEAEYAERVQAEVEAEAQAFDAQADAQPKVRRTNDEKLAQQWDRLMEAVELRQSLGRKKAAEALNTSVGRLDKMLKAYGLMQQYPYLWQRVCAGVVSYTKLQYLAIRRDGLDQLRALGAIED